MRFFCDFFSKNDYDEQTHNYCYCRQNDIISQLIYSLSNQNRFYKKSSCYVLRAVAKHSAQLAEDIVRSGALPPLIHNLSDLDYQVKEAAAWSLGYIAKHNKELASQVVEAGAIENLILCLQEPEVSLKRAVVQTLSYISDHSDELAEKIAHAGIDIISHYLNYNEHSQAFTRPTLIVYYYFHNFKFF